MDSRAVPPTARKKIIEFDAEAAPRGAVSRLCEDLGVSRAVFYKIRAQAARHPDDPTAALTPERSGPAEHPGVIGPQMESTLVAKRAELAAGGWDCGPESVRSRLVRAGVEDVPSRATIARLFARLGLSKREPSKRPHASYRRFRWPRANDMWQLDGTEVRLDDGRGSKQVVYQVEDDHSRAVLAWAIDRTENSRAAIKVVADAVGRWGAPVRFLTDNGTSFNMSRRGLTAPLENWLAIRGVKPVTGKPGKPTTQGKNERLHRTLKQFLEANRPIATPGELAALVERFTTGYNEERPHQELDPGQTPAEAYRAAAKAPSPPPPVPLAPPPAPSPETGRAALGPRPGGGPPSRSTPPEPPADAKTEIASRTVLADGKVYALGVRTYAGRERIGQTVHVHRRGDRIDAYDDQGEHLGWALAPARKRGGRPPFVTLQPAIPGLN
ncbi:MAG: DDE-type integrase/transposase/recombinase [Propionibacteriaceae bacterium]|jgi:transposase InsO family protein|nr:DDE-type integrase/transposase/recombinase [Propionibacteriaceae bacterium]